jgi:undecaprenyl diphosphate synthase
MTLYVAVSYGGRWDIVEGARRLARRVQAGELPVDAIDEARFAAELSLHDAPEPDLFIRTGGEHRISNFLLWNLAYTELYFCDTLWPDFDDAALEGALRQYARRQRRFGLTAAQARSHE